MQHIHMVGINSFFPNQSNLSMYLCILPDLSLCAYTYTHRHIGSPGREAVAVASKFTGATLENYRSQSSKASTKSKILVSRRSAIPSSPLFLYSSPTSCPPVLSLRQALNYYWENRFSKSIFVSKKIDLILQYRRPFTFPWKYVCMILFH